MEAHKKCLHELRKNVKIVKQLLIHQGNEYNMARESYTKVYMTEEERKKLEQFAEALGWTFSEFEMLLTKEVERKNNGKPLRLCSTSLS